MTETYEHDSNAENLVITKEALFLFCASLVMA